MWQISLIFLDKYYNRDKNFHKFNIIRAPNMWVIVVPQGLCYGKQFLAGTNKIITCEQSIPHLICAIRIING